MQAKSALINRLLKRRVVRKVLPRPGVTRQLRWIRPDQLGVTGFWYHPRQVDNQSNSCLKLAICERYRDASYDNQRVAAALVDLLNQLQAAGELLPKNPYSHATN